MRELAILTFQTLDGVMQAPGSSKEDTSGGFTSGGWARSCWEEVMTQVKREAMHVPYDLLLGGSTYDLFASSFSAPVEGNEVAEKLNRAKKYVVTSREEKLTWNNSAPIKGELQKEILRLKQQNGPLLQVHGSWQLIQFLLKHRLIDEFRLWTFPIIAGSGKKLFHTKLSENLNLIKSQTSPSGAVMTFYRP